jgi:type I restriction enzyme R subunit
VVSEEVVDIFDAVGLDKPNIGILDDAFLAQVRNLPERNLAVELLERLLEGEIKSRFASNVVQKKKFSELLTDVIKRYQNRSIETAQVMEELIGDGQEVPRGRCKRGEQLGLTEDEVRFYDALANNESAVRELTDETLKKIAHELTENLRKNLSVDWSARKRAAKLRLMVKRILRKYKYPPDQQEAAVELVLQQAQMIGENSPWMQT